MARQETAGLFCLEFWELGLYHLFLLSQYLFRNNSNNHLGLEEDLQKICDKEDVSFELFQKLFEIERDYQNMERRFGIFEKGSGMSSIIL